MFFSVTTVCCRQLMSLDYFTIFLLDIDRMDVNKLKTYYVFNVGSGEVNNESNTFFSLVSTASLRDGCHDICIYTLPNRIKN